ncbi:metal cation symporter ZIP14 isoform X2 [Nematostella vectensis]|uniref:metal cation symporter ZIP14 isoform X2 n=1 Tax=Nematostella vectensis TaxID=45351 RepID=UPI00207746F8|nr:metal cation symporter ZIP14 isoform X2 [Nematostella vectensis]
MATVVGLLLLGFLAGTGFSHDSLDDGHGQYTFADFTARLHSRDTLSFTDINKIFEKLYFENCTSTGRKQDCNRCFSPSDLGLSSSTLLNATEFAAKSVAIVYYLTPGQNAGLANLSAVCNTSIAVPNNLFATIRSKYGANSSHGITTHALDGILQAINTTLGKNLSKKKCFNAESITEGVHASSGHSEHGGHKEETLDEHDFEHACASIVSHLYQGYCIGESHHDHDHAKNLPDKKFFLDYLYKNKQYLDEDDLSKIAKKLGIAINAKPSSESHDGHSHKRKRRAAEATPTTATPHNQTCFTLDQMLEVFGIDHAIGASRLYFKELCPAFIQQAISGSCAAKASATKKEDAEMAKVWGYGFLAVTIISLVSILGVVTIPLMDKTFYKKVLALLVSLAVGTLAGDGVLHLIPHAFGLHKHEEDGAQDHDHNNAYIWKAVVVLASIYIFFVFEVLMHFGLKKRVHSHSHVDVEIPGPNIHNLSVKRKCSKLEHHEGTPPADDEDEEQKDIVLTNVVVKENGHTAENGTTPIAPKQPHHKKESLMKALSRKSVFKANGEDEEKPSGISSVAWMIIIGDTIHNISDGLAIGAAFSEGGSSGISGGISTSIAVFCHELPHELGDFAVLLTAGMSVKMALLANLLSACSCYLGLIIGIVIGQQMEVRLWIFAVAGGMFIYVALVDMLPDLMHSESLQTDTWKTFLLQNIGILTGFALMLIIAVFEEDLMATKF